MYREYQANYVKEITFSVGQRLLPVLNSYLK